MKWIIKHIAQLVNYGVLVVTGAVVVTALVVAAFVVPGVPDVIVTVGLELIVATVVVVAGVPVTPSIGVLAGAKVGVVIPDVPEFAFEAVAVEATVATTVEVSAGVGSSVGVASGLAVGRGVAVGIGPAVVTVCNKPGMVGLTTISGSVLVGSGAPCGVGEGVLRAEVVLYRNIKLNTTIYTTSRAGSIIIIALAAVVRCAHQPSCGSSISDCSCGIS